MLVVHKYPRRPRNLRTHPKLWDNPFYRFNILHPRTLPQGAGPGGTTRPRAPETLGDAPGPSPGRRRSTGSSPPDRAPRHSRPVSLLHPRGADHRSRLPSRFVARQRRQWTSWGRGRNAASPWELLRAPTVSHGLPPGAAGAAAILDSGGARAPRLCGKGERVRSPPSRSRLRRTPLGAAAGGICPVRGVPIGALTGVIVSGAWDWPLADGVVGALDISRSGAYYILPRSGIGRFGTGGLLARIISPPPLATREGGLCLIKRQHHTEGLI